MTKIAIQARRSGRTTAALERLCTLLHSGQYDAGVFVVHHVAFDRYCLQVIANNIVKVTLYEPQKRKLYFRNFNGNLVSIQFVDGRDEAMRLRGIKLPVVRDHHVLEERHLDRKLKKGETLAADIMAQGRDPWSDICIPNI